MVVDVFVLFVGAGVFIVIGFDVCVQGDSNIWFRKETYELSISNDMMGSFTTGIFKSY